MKNIRLIIVAAMLFAMSLLAAEGWQLDSDVMVNLTQSSYSDNWTGSELSNITWVAASNSTAQKQLKEWLKNKTSLNLAFGQTHLQKTDGNGNKYWEAPEKSTDKIALESLLQFTLQSFVDPYVAGRLDSQFLDEQAGQETFLVNPLLFTESAGIMKTILDLEKTKLDVRLGGAVRENVDRRLDDVPVDGGVEGVANFKHVFSALNASYNSKLTAYQALFNSKSDELPNEDWKALDYKWENLLTFKLWKLLGVNLTFDMIYDKEKAPEAQWKESLGLGLSYTLF
ncbi:MAG TPA: DUF3078 domain-containing protein [Candidatus Syntrophosphaera sp.]|nr:DUF3078 domain-containing protein [Candidatus Syntrophosphaera sp.]